MDENPQSPERKTLPKLQELRQRGFTVKRTSDRKYMVLEAENTIRVGVGPSPTGVRTERDTYPVERKDDARNVQQPLALQDAYEIKGKEVLRQITGEELIALATRLAFPGRVFGKKSAAGMLKSKRDDKPEPLPLQQKIGKGRKKNPTPKETYHLMGYSEIQVEGQTYLYKGHNGEFVILVKVEGAVKWKGEVKDDYDKVDEAQDPDLFYAVKAAISKYPESIPARHTEAELKAKGFERREIDGFIYMIKITDSMTFHSKKVLTGGDVSHVIDSTVKGVLSNRRHRSPEGRLSLERVFTKDFSTDTFTEITDRQTLGMLKEKLKLPNRGGDAD